VRILNYADYPADCGDYVVAVGCTDILTTGSKREKKKYYFHNTKPGALKEITMDGMFSKWGGAEVLRRAVRGMLPKNKLRVKRLSRLKAIEGWDHPYKANVIKTWRPGTNQSIADLPRVKRAFTTAKATENREPAS
jgi:large subunit ribosomal protein L13